MSSVAYRNVDRVCAGEAVRTALRWSPDRIIFGEVRYGEVADELIKSWNTGHTGNVTMIHADTAASMMLRMRDLVAEVIVGQIPDITKAIHLCIHLSKRAGGPPIVDEVMPVKEGDGALLNLMREHGAT